MRLLAIAAALLGKELRTEFRSRELLITTMFFVLTVIALFSITFDAAVSDPKNVGPGLLWLGVLFSSSVVLQTCFLEERANDTFSALRCAVLGQFAIVLPKLGASWR